MKKHLISSLLIFYFMGLYAQNNTNIWCLSECQLAGDEMKNTSLLYNFIQSSDQTRILQIQNTKNGLVKATSKIHDELIHFPLRICIVKNNTMGIELLKNRAKDAISALNHSYSEVRLQFSIDTIEILQSDIHLEDLYSNGYAPYNQFSAQHDRSDMISIYIFDHGKEFCEISPDRISCGRIGGFSYIFSEATNNIVMSNFDLSDQKIVAHEMGHFFGLYHPFEEFQFGKDKFDKEECQLVGDRICDTPPDPGSVYEVYVNYSTCEMVGLKSESGEYYQPLLNNFMSYYKPCYLKEYEFTNGQIEVLRMAAQSDIRTKFQREITENNTEKKCFLFKTKKGN